MIQTAVSIEGSESSSVSNLLFQGFYRLMILFLPILQQLELKVSIVIAPHKNLVVSSIVNTFLVLIHTGDTVREKSRDSMWAGSDWSLLRLLLLLSWLGSL